MKPLLYLLETNLALVLNLSLSWSYDLRFCDLKKSQVGRFSAEKIGLISLCLISLSRRPLRRARDQSGCIIFSSEYVVLTILIDLSLGLDLAVDEVKGSTIGGEKTSCRAIDVIYLLINVIFGFSFCKKSCSRFAIEYFDLLGIRYSNVCIPFSQRQMYPSNCWFN